MSRSAVRHHGVCLAISACSIVSRFIVDMWAAFWQMKTFGPGVPAAHDSMARALALLALLLFVGARPSRIVPDLTLYVKSLGFDLEAQMRSPFPLCPKTMLALADAVLDNAPSTLSTVAKTYSDITTLLASFDRSVPSNAHRWLAGAALDVLADGDLNTEQSFATLRAFISSFVTGSALLLREPGCNADRIVRRLCEADAARAFRVLDLFADMLAPTQDAAWTGAAHIAAHLLAGARSDAEAAFVGTQLAKIAHYRPFPAALILHAVATGSRHASWMIQYSQAAEMNAIESLFNFVVGPVEAPPFLGTEPMFAADYFAMMHLTYIGSCLAVSNFVFSPYVLFQSIVRSAQPYKPDYIHALLQLGSIKSFTMADYAILAILRNCASTGSRDILKALMAYEHDVNLDTPFGSNALGNMLLDRNILSVVQLKSRHWTTCQLARELLVFFYSNRKQIQYF